MSKREKIIVYCENCNSLYYTIGVPPKCLKCGVKQEEREEE
jgi:hypothetical protein